MVCSNTGITLAHRKHPETLARFGPGNAKISACCWNEQAVVPAPYEHSIGTALELGLAPVLCSASLKRSSHQVIPTDAATGVPFERDTLGSRITDFAVLDFSRRGFPPKEAGRMGKVKLWGGSGARNMITFKI